MFFRAADNTNSRHDKQDIKTNFTTKNESHAFYFYVLIDFLQNIAYQENQFHCSFPQIVSKHNIPTK